MLEKISTSDDLLKRLRREQKSELLNRPQHLTAADSLNLFMKTVKTEFQIKDKNSQASASEVKLTA